jgi:NAD(P)-dependent dehydrogenase (short-subunit alcohol dehydrogenase family)
MSVSGDRFAGKVALVTGGASGIGAATVAALRAEGARVAVLDQTDAGSACDVALTVDVADAAALSDAVTRVVDELGGLDVAVNAAGISPMPTGFTDVTAEDWARVIAVNLTGVFNSMQAELVPMLERGAGSIVNVSSAAGLIGYPGLPAYVASKHGVLGLTKTAALEYARRGVRVNAVCPGLVRTPMLMGSLSREEIDRLGRGAPVGRVAEPDEIAAVILHLASDDSSYVTGHAMAVDGGALAT